jgi:3-hydroxybutyrate dehydrogenase
VADTTVEEAFEKYGPSELTRDGLLELDDPHFALENAALATGAGSGIGQATALAFAASGPTVVATDRDKGRLGETTS